MNTAMTGMTVERFKEVAKLWVPFFDTTIISAVALRTEDGWHLRHANILLYRDMASGIKPYDLEVKTASIYATRSLKKGNTSEFLRSFDELAANPAAVILKDAPIQFGQKAHTTGSLYRPFGPNPQGPLVTYRWVELQLFSQLGGSEKFPTRTELDLELLSAEPPFEHFGDLLVEFGAQYDLLNSSQGSTVTCTLLPPAIIEEPHSFHRGKLQLRINAHPKMDRGKFSIGVKTVDKNQAPIRRRLSGKKIKWRSKKGAMIGELNVLLEQRPLAVSLLEYDGEHLSRWLTTDPARSFSDRLPFHKAIDPSNKFAASFFDSRDDFQGCVEVLLSLLGLNILAYGDIAHLADAPDIIAISSQGHVYLIECTTGDIDHRGKIQRFYERTKRIRESLATTQTPMIAIQSVIFSSMNRSETTHHHGHLAALGISLVCREEIANLLARIEFPPNPKELYESTMAAIPAVPGPESA